MEVPPLQQDYVWAGAEGELSGARVVFTSQPLERNLGEA